MDITPEKIETLIHEKFRLENMTKPMKGVSTYKVCEIEEIARKIGISSEEIEKYKKPDLYQMIMAITSVIY